MFTCFDTIPDRDRQADFLYIFFIRVTGQHNHNTEHNHTQSYTNTLTREDTVNKQHTHTHD